MWAGACALLLHPAPSSPAHAAVPQVPPTPAAAPRTRQVWLLLHNLLVDPAARAHIDLTEARCDVLLRLRRLFNELLLDQVQSAAACRAARWPS